MSLRAREAGATPQDTSHVLIQDLKEDLLKCGHSKEKLEELEPKAVQRPIENKSGHDRKISRKQTPWCFH